MHSVLWHCWLGGRKGIRPVKNWVVRCWHGYLSGAICRCADLHMAQLMPLPLTVSCFSKIQIGFTFLVPAHLGNPGKGPLNGRCCCCIYTVSWKLVCCCGPSQWPGDVDRLVHLHGQWTHLQSIVYGYCAKLQIHGSWVIVDVTVVAANLSSMD